MSASRELDAGPVASLAAERVRVIALGRKDIHGRPREVLLVLDRLGRPRAYENLCRHLPVPLDGGTRDFLAEDGCHLLCGTHGARYRLEDGHCVSGPCEGDDLDRHDVEVVGGRLRVRLRPLADEP